MSDTMKACPNCGKENPEKAADCAHCGVALGEGLERIEVAPKDIGGIPTESLDLSEVEAGQPALYRLGLRHPESGKLFSFPALGSYILGRISEGQSILPDVDFAPLQGFEAGVSRLHAMINISETGISLTDLGSSNGTLINGERMQERVERKIENGDKIQLGRLQIQAEVNPIK